MFRCSQSQIPALTGLPPSTIVQTKQVPDNSNLYIELNYHPTTQELEVRSIGDFAKIEPNDYCGCYFWIPLQPLADVIRMLENQSEVENDQNHCAHPFRETALEIINNYLNTRDQPHPT